METIFEKHLSDKGLVSKIYKELLKVNNKKTQLTHLKMSKISGDTLSKKDIQIANTHMKRGSTSHVIRQSQNKTTLR